MANRSDLEWVQRALGTFWPEGFVSLTRRCCTLRPCPPHSCQPGARERHAAYVEPPCRVRSRESIVGRHTNLANMLCSVLCQCKMSMQTQCSCSYYGRCADACGIQFGTGSLCMFRQDLRIPPHLTFTFGAQNEATGIQCTRPPM